jgi:hypothetical protein
LKGRKNGALKALLGKKVVNMFTAISTAAKRRNSGEATTELKVSFLKKYILNAPKYNFGFTKSVLNIFVTNKK